MSEALKSLYIDVLKYNWKIDGYYRKPNGYVVIYVTSPWSNYTNPFSIVLF